MLSVSSPPIVTSVVAVDTHSVQVGWMIPNRVNGIIIYYTITYITDAGIGKDIVYFLNGQPVSVISYSEHLYVIA